MKAKLTVLPTLSVHPNQINVYNELNWNPSRPSKVNYLKESENEEPVFQHLLESNRTANGNISKIAKRKINKAVDYLLLLTSEKKVQNRMTGRMFRFKVAFVTLTLPSAQVHDDNEIKSKCLNQFLIEIKKSYKVRLYIWRAEKQKNGNLHFHILVDRFIPHQELRDRWNRIINKLGYIDRYRQEQLKWHSEGFKVRVEMLPTWSKEKQYAAYLRGQKCNWNSPNSTDVHSLYKINNVKLYISKYMTKNESNLDELNKETKEFIEQKGRVWSSCEELMNLKGAVSLIDNELDNELLKLRKSGKCKIIDEPYYSCVMLNDFKLSMSETPRLYKLFYQYLFQQFMYSVHIQAF